MKLTDLHYRFALVFILVSAGIAHFIVPNEFTGAVPEPFRPALFWVYFTGFIELIAAAGLLYAKTRRLTAWLLMFYFLALLPAHFEMLIREHEIFGFSDRNFFIFRIFLQVIPVWIAWKSRLTETTSVFPFIDRFEELLLKRWKQPVAWHSKWLFFAFLYNVGFGFWVVIFPAQAFELFNMPVPEYLYLWQTVGMIVGVYGIGYAIAALNEIRHFPIVLVGLLGKIFGPIGFVFTWLNGDIPLAFGILIIFNDLIWYPAFIGIFLRFRKESGLRQLSWNSEN